MNAKESSSWDRAVNALYLVLLLIMLRPRGGPPLRTVLAWHTWRVSLALSRAADRAATRAGRAYARQIS